MPDSKRLREYYKNEKVNFIYISIDEDQAAWERIATQIGLPKQASYIMPKGSKTALFKKYKISTIPKYMLLNKDGIVISADAPRPSDLNVKVFINSYLK